jgi:hypothetical protein
MSEKEDSILAKLDKIDDTLTTIQIAAKAVEVVLMGAQGDNGICSTVKHHGKQLEKLKNWKAQLVGCIVGISSFITLLFKYIPKWWDNG